MYNNDRVSNVFSTFPVIFSNQILQIPKNQRGYSWQKDNVTAIWKDLDLALKGKNHYFGPIVLSHNKTGNTITNTLKYFFIDDGQQRVTTYFILIHRILYELQNSFIKKIEDKSVISHDLLQSEIDKVNDTSSNEDGNPILKFPFTQINERLFLLEGDDADNRNSNFFQYLLRIESSLINMLKIFRSDNTFEFKLQMKEPELNDFFHNLLTYEENNNQPPDIKSSPQKNLWDTFDLAKEHYSKSGMGLIELLLSLHDLVERSQFLLIDLTLANVDRYLTFDAINSRGLELTQFDKIKNYSAFICNRLGGLQTNNIDPSKEWYLSLRQFDRFGLTSREDEEKFINDIFNAFFHKDEKQKQVNSKKDKQESKTSWLIPIDQTHYSFVEHFKSLADIEPDDRGQVTIPNGELKKKRDQLVEFIEEWPRYAESYAFISCTEQSIKGSQARIGYREYHNTPNTLLCLQQNQTPSKAYKYTLDWLKRYENLNFFATCRSLLVGCHYIFDNQEFFEIAKLVEIFTFRTFCIAKTSPDNFHHRFQQILFFSKSGKLKAVDVRKRLCFYLSPEYYKDLKVKDYNKADMQSCINLLMQKRYGSWKQLHYFLNQYEKSLFNQGMFGSPWIKEMDLLKRKKETIEHILPKNYRPQSKSEDFDDWYQSWTDPEFFEKLKDRLGNLVLTLNNGNYKNKSIRKKINNTKACYNQGFNAEKEISSFLRDSFEHENIKKSYEEAAENDNQDFEHGSNKFKTIQFKDFTEYKDWTYESIFDREIKLIKFFIERWGFVCCGSNSYKINMWSNQINQELVESNKNKFLDTEELKLKYNTSWENEVERECVGLLNDDDFKRITSEDSTNIAPTDDDDIEEELE